MTRQEVRGLTCDHSENALAHTISSEITEQTKHARGLQLASREEKNAGAEN